MKNNMDETFTEQIKNELLDDIEHYEAEAQLWKQVKRQHKKDGSDFKRLEQNFTSCEFNTIYGWRHIVVYGRYGKNNQFFAGQIHIATEGVSLFSSADELQAAIRKRIEELEERATERRKVVGIVEEAVDDFQQEINAAKDKLRERINVQDIFDHIISEYKNTFRYRY